MSDSFQSSTIDPEEAKRKAAEERKAKQAASLKEREDKVKQDKTALERAAGKSRVEAGREESGRAYKALLIDAVRDHEVRNKFPFVIRSVIKVNHARYNPPRLDGVMLSLIWSKIPALAIPP